MSSPGEDSLENSFPPPLHASPVPRKSKTPSKVVEGTYTCSTLPSYALPGVSF